MHFEMEAARFVEIRGHKHREPSLGQGCSMWALHLKPITGRHRSSAVVQYRLSCKGDVVGR